MLGDTTISILYENSVKTPCHAVSTMPLSLHMQSGFLFANVMLLLLFPIFIYLPGSAPMH